MPTYTAPLESSRIHAFRDQPIDPDLDHPSLRNLSLVYILALLPRSHLGEYGIGYIS